MIKPVNTLKPVTAYSGFVIAITVPTKTYAMMNITGIKGYNFIL